MRFYLISDNVDTQVGMRLAGIEGVVVHKEDEVRQALQAAMEQEDIAVVLITETLLSLCPEMIYNLKLNRRRPLIVEIPDRHGNGRTRIPSPVMSVKRLALRFSEI
jgi:V/A-type H+/Na+-transporting ATPase subunit F